MAVNQKERAQPAASGNVLDEWIEPHLPTVFSRWFPKQREALRASAAAVIAAADVEPGDAVLDIGSGAGIPALDVAKAVGPAGRVIATDPSPIFVEALIANARQDGLTNLEAIQADVLSLPFGPGSFDAATCHMAVMFFPDVQAGLRRIREVLRPGGRAGFVAWGPEQENQFFGAFWGVARPYLPAAPAGGIAPAAADAPGPQRYSASGSLSTALRAAGFADVREELRTVEMVWPGTVETLARHWLDLSAIEAKVADERRADLHREVRRSLARFAGSGSPRFTAALVVASGLA
jgi:SAM-dependent methyltransferase